MKIKIPINKKLSREDLIEFIKNKDAETIAKAIMDSTKEAFDETNFYCYYYFMQIANRVNTLVKDEIISVELGKEIHQEIARFFNKCLVARSFENDILGK